MKRLIALAASGALLALGALVPARAADAGRTRPSLSFFASGNAAAHWDNSYSNDNDPFSVQLHVGDATSYAGATLQHVAGAAPATSPSFDFASDQSGPSGGSPRLVMVFANGYDINLAPDSWTGKTWQTVGDGYWSVHGGPCVASYHDNYEHALGCMGGSPVTAAFIVSDSGWLYPTGYTNWVDNIQYGGATLSQPSDNANG